VNESAAQPPGLAHLAIVFFLSLAGFLFASLSLSRHLGLPGAGLTQLLFFLVVPLLLSLRWAGFRATTVAPLAAPRAVVAPALLLAPAVVLLLVFYEGFQEAYLFSFQEKIARTYRETLALDETPVVWVYVVGALVPALCEEVFFRGICLGVLLERLPAWAAVGLSALLFAAVHLPETMPPIFLLGVLLGLCRLLTGSLWPCVAAHLLNNLLAVWWLTARPAFLAEWFAYRHWKLAAATAATAGLLALAWKLGPRGRPRPTASPRPPPG